MFSLENKPIVRFASFDIVILRQRSAVAGVAVFFFAD